MARNERLIFISMTPLMVLLSMHISSEAAMLISPILIKYSALSAIGAAIRILLPSSDPAIITIRKAIAGALLGAAIGFILREKPVDEMYKEALCLACGLFVEVIIALYKKYIIKKQAAENGL